MKKSPKNFLGYVIILFAILITIGTLVTIPNTLEAKTTGTIMGRIVGMVLLLFVALVLFRIGKKLAKVKKPEVEVR